MRITKQTNFPSNINQVHNRRKNSSSVSMALNSPSFKANPLPERLMVINFKEKSSAFRQLIKNRDILNSQRILELFRKEEQINPKTPIMTTVTDFIINDRPNREYFEDQFLDYSTPDLIRERPFIANSLLKSRKLKSWIEGTNRGYSYDLLMEPIVATTEILLKENPKDLFKFFNNFPQAFLGESNRGYPFERFLKETYYQFLEHPEFLDTLKTKSEHCQKCSYPIMPYLKTLTTFTEALREKKLKNYYNNNEILNVINKTDFGEKDSYSETKCVLNLPIDDKKNTVLLRFAEIIPDKNNKEAYNKAIDKLTELGALNFNQKDFFGTSLFEKAMNSENESLLKFITEKSYKIDYHPELDIAYNNMSSEENKKLVRNINVNFQDIIDAFNCRSTQSLEKLENQLKSPFMTSKNFNSLVEYLLERSDYKNDPEFIDQALEILSKYITDDILENM